jgi:hypothetical protein
MSGLQRSIEIPITIGKIERKFTVNFPTVGQYISVESRKAQLTIPKALSFDQSTQYLNMIRQGTISSNIALDLVDCIAWFEVLMPTLMTDKEISVGGLVSIEDLDIFDAKPLLDAYKKVFKPWKDAWEKVFQGFREEKVEEVETK